MMNKLLESLIEHPDVSIAITMGEEHWSNGETTLVIQGDGSLKISNLRSGETKSYEGELDHSRLQAVGKSLAQADIGLLRPSDELREPDDMPVTVKIFLGDLELLNQELWEGDRFTDANLNSVIMLFEKLVSEFTEDALPYG